MAAAFNGVLLNKLNLVPFGTDHGFTRTNRPTPASAICVAGRISPEPPTAPALLQSLAKQRTALRKIAMGGTANLIDVPGVQLSYALDTKTGIARFMNSSNKGTVNAISP